MFGMFVKLCMYHHFLIPTHFHHLPKETGSISSHSLFVLCPSLQKPLTTFCLYGLGLFWTFRNLGILQHGAFFSWCSPASRSIAQIRVFPRDDPGARAVCALLYWVHCQRPEAALTGVLEWVPVLALLLWSNGSMRASLMTLFSNFIFAPQRKKRRKVGFLSH